MTRADSTVASAPPGAPDLGLIDDLDHGRRRRRTEASTEELLARDPDVILLTCGGSETNIKTDADDVQALRGRVSLDQLTAVREGRVIPINFAYLVGGPLTVDGLETIVDGLARLP
ncbi:MAG: hypothetical protein ACRDRH_05990 [Pseudonocardia sp.]